MGDTSARARCAAPATTATATATAGQNQTMVSDASAGSVSSLEAVHLSPLVEAAIRLLPGNDRCADCKSIYPQWAGVSFGVLLCLACAGKHRALGVSVSFVKSLGMDSWSPTEQRALEVGGNAKWIAVCAGTAIIDLAIAHKYTSAVARAYKHRISLIAGASKATTGGIKANEFLAQLMETAAVASVPTSPDDVASLRASLRELSPPPLPSPPSLTTPHPSERHENASVAAPVLETRNSRVYSTDLMVKCTTCQHEVPLNEIDAHSKQCVVRSQATVQWRKYDRTFGRANESLGFSLTKTKGGFAEITRVTPGGEAEQAGVVVGSYVVGLNAHRTSAFKELVGLVSSLERPIHFHFVCRSSKDNAVHSSVHSTDTTVAFSTRALAAISSVPEPVTVETEAIFDESVREIGCVLQVQNNRCVVTAVDEDSAAQTQSVLVGSCVVAVNGRHILRGPDAIEAIQKSSRPLRITFHRVEGLMRGWKSS